MILRLRYPQDEIFQYRPGQFIGLEAVDGRQRFFSLANAEPVNNELELHVNRIPGGAFTNALFEKARVGDEIWMEGPFGDFSIPDEAGANIILVAGGTGFAPIRACLERIAAAGTAADRVMHLYWGVRSREDLYDLAGVTTLRNKLPGLRFTAVLDQSDGSEGVRTGFVHRAVIEDFQDLSDFEIYACGAPAMIEALNRDCAAERGFDPNYLTADVFASGPGSAGDAAGATGQIPVALTLHGHHGPETVEAFEGESLLTALKRAGFALLAVCGGNGACGTCRVQVPPTWRSRLPAASKHELRLLKHVAAGEGDRLSCRIPLTTALSGLEIYTCADR